MTDVDSEWQIEVKTFFVELTLYVKTLHSEEEHPCGINKFLAVQCTQCVKDCFCQSVMKIPPNWRQ